MEIPEEAREINDEPMLESVLTQSEQQGMNELASIHGKELTHDRLQNISSRDQVDAHELSLEELKKNGSAMEQGIEEGR